ncbi:DUF4393 domain-containing protein [Exiguobacterium sp. SL14]|nr:DUF4393 domain-containing protein [Exiguobacterium sp. SL14]MCY1690720.1 DUF4393 domain-containing protein [Exiguobacterium sp. SL14]
MPEQSLINIVAPKFLDNALSGPAQEVGNTLANIFHVIFGPVYYPTQKYRIKQAANLKKYEEEIQKELGEIPEGNLIDPPLNIVGSALEASKFHIEEDEIRQMFAKLIASSMNSDSSPYVHTSFVETIKQLSPLDAINLKIIADKTSLPVVNYSIQETEEYSFKPALDNVFLNNNDCQDMLLIGPSISNLNRLGLIKIDFTSQLTDKSLYDVFEHNSDYLELINTKINYGFFNINIQKGIVGITPLGKQFILVCGN